MALGAGARTAVSKTRIVGIVLARDEDLLLGQALANAGAFCDEWILCDHRSVDGTARILETFARSAPDASFHRIRHPRESHDLLRRFAGTATWVFGLDGDELYDAEGLARFRPRLLAGEFDRSWMVLGNVLHVTQPGTVRVRGHLAPPARSMTKLYNFGAIRSWDGRCPERLHGGHPRFLPGHGESDKLTLHETTPWERADFRCLHFCFQPRSSVRPDEARPNIMETFGNGPLHRWRRLAARVLGRGGASAWKDERYRRGPEVEVDAAPFSAAPAI